MRALEEYNGPSLSGIVKDARGLGQFRFHSADHSGHVSRLCQIAVNLLPNSLQCAIKIWKACQNQRQSFILRPAHRADDSKSISRLSNLALGQQNIDPLS